MGKPVLLKVLKSHIWVKVKKLYKNITLAKVKVIHTDSTWAKFCKYLILNTRKYHKIQVKVNHTYIHMHSMYILGVWLIICSDV